MRGVLGRGEILREIQQGSDTHLIVFLGAELDERRVNFLVDGTTHVHDVRIE